MVPYYNIGTLVLVRDPFHEHDVICVVVGIGSAMLHGDRDNILYHGYSLSHNHDYFFFDLDVIRCLSKE